MIPALPLLGTLLSMLAVAPAAPAPDSLSLGAMQAVRATGTLSVDGVLDEPEWQGAPTATRFVQSDQHEGDLATERTEVRVLYDDDALYVGARLWDSHADSIVARLCRRDDTSVPCDRFTLYVDPFHDRRSGYFFAVNAAGVLLDGTLFNDSWDDNSWDGVWQGKAKRDPQGWTVEMRVPFSQMRFRREGALVWGINFRRDIARRTERDWITFLHKSEAGFVSRFEELHGLGQLPSRAAVELMPYVTGKAEYLRWNADNPFKNDSRYTPAGGADLRAGIAGKLTLNATVNPDFGQVEVDPATVNLSDVESYFQEKRPFFVENARVFSFGNEGASDYWGFNWPEPQFFYSRRIGRAPQGDVSSADFTDLPVATDIFGAAKLTGQLAPGFNFGTLHALTAHETGRLDNGGVLTRQEVEPLTYYGLARGLHEFHDRRFGIGLLSSLVERRFKDDVLRDQLNRSSYTGGADGWLFLDRNKVWVVSGYTAVSTVQGTPERMVNLQRSSRRYFQRPDQSYVSVDSGATSLTGWVSRFWINKQSGKNFIFNSAFGAVNPRFETNDIGFQSRADVINGHLGMGWAFPDANRWRKSGNILGALFGSRDFGGNTTWSGVWSSVNLDFMNNHNTRVSFAYNPRTVSDTRTRGGPTIFNMPGTEENVHYNTDRNRKLYYYLDVYNYHRVVGNSWNYGFWPGVEFKPRPNLLVSVGPGFERNIEDAQYITSIGDPVATSTFGRRYVFGLLDQSTLSADLRLNWSFAPNLSLQTFIQPLISAGQYMDIKQLARPRSYDFVRFGADSVSKDASGWTVHPADGGAPFNIGDPNFNFRSLRGNAVLRWEYLPGSTLYLVWTQERSENVSDTNFQVRRSIGQLAKVEPNNIFLAKVTYYLTR